MKFRQRQGSNTGSAKGQIKYKKDRKAAALGVPRKRVLGIKK